VKQNKVPPMTLADRLRRDLPNKQPPLGRPQELSQALEQALVKCPVICAKFQFPMKTKDLQDIMQSYCVEHNVKIRWVDEQPGKDWIRIFQKRWRHKVKLKRPTNIKLSRAKVSPADVREFFARLTPNLKGIPYKIGT
jgi:hypothetical protein